jgi:hypothetical protein
MVLTAATETPSPPLIQPHHYMELSVYSAAMVRSTIQIMGGMLIATGRAAISEIVAGVETVVTPGAGTWAASAYIGRFTGGIFNNAIPVLNCRSCNPAYRPAAGPPWVEDGGLAAAYGMTRVGALRPYREFLVAMGLSNAGGPYASDTVAWSDAAASLAYPATWTPTAANQAGNVVLQGGGEVIDGCTLGDDFIIYKRTRCWRMSYIGGQFVMAFKPLFNGLGAFSQNCIQEHNGRHYVFTGSDFVVHDGQTWQSLVTGKMRQRMVVPASSRSYVYLDRTSREAWVCVDPVGNTDPTRAVVVNIDTGECTERNLPSVRGMLMDDQELASSGVYPRGVYADAVLANCRRYVFNSTTRAGDAYLTRTHLDLGKPHVKKLVKWVRPIVSGSLPGNAMTVSVTATNRVDEAVSWTNTGTAFTVGTTDRTEPYALTPPIEGRYLHFRFFVASGIQGTIDLAGFDVGYEERGEH